MDDIGFYNIASEQKYEDGEIIFEEGKSGDWVCVVLEGSVEVSKTVTGGKFILGKLGRGEIFGELALLGAVKRTATVRAIGETTIGIIDREFLDKELNKMSSDLRNMVVSAAQRFKKVIDRIQGFSH
ncbi:MAG: cyclic nucleotide-binding domain-containing protein [Desulfobacterales bacterium]|nr:cyclic nucleotide-binding domain-containing protein [Desulfobacterales bacterium]